MNWTKIVDAIHVPAKPPGVWTLVYQYLSGPTLLKVEAAADGIWNYSDADSCNADGDTDSFIKAKNCLLATAPVGALIGKIGGSTADGISTATASPPVIPLPFPVQPQANSSGATIFLVGRSCVFAVPTGTAGPLYLTINDELSGLTNNSGSLAVTISQSP